MHSKPIQTLVNYFLKFPGVGPRQAARFAFHLLREDPTEVGALSGAIARLHDEVKICSQCYKTFDMNELGANHSTGPEAAKQITLCEFCRNSKRNQNQILVVEKEVDLENIERTRKYEGLYHVLGGTVSPLDSSAPARLHLRELFDRIQSRAKAGEAIEIILATNPTTEGDTTALYIDRIVAPLKNQHPDLNLSRLGRGLTTGSELEYSDDITIANALENRK